MALVRFSLRMSRCCLLTLTRALYVLLPAALSMQPSQTQYQQSYRGTGADTAYGYYIPSVNITNCLFDSNGAIAASVTDISLPCSRLRTYPLRTRSCRQSWRRSGARLLIRLF